MRDVRNPKLRKILNTMGIKDIVLNFDGGFVSVWSEDDLTDTILHYADNSIETRTFSDYSIDDWVEMIKDIFDEGLEHYENHKNWNENKTISMKKDNINSSVGGFFSYCFDDENGFCREFDTLSECKRMAKECSRRNPQMEITIYGLSSFCYQGGKQV